MRASRRERQAFCPVFDSLSLRIAPACVMGPIPAPPTCFAPVDATTALVAAPNTTGVPVISTDPVAQDLIVSVLTAK